MAKPNAGFDTFTKNILDALGIDSSSSLNRLKEANEILSLFAVRGTGKNMMQRLRFTKGVLNEMMEASKFTEKLRKFSESGSVPTRKSEGYLTQGFRSGTYGRVAFIRNERSAWSQYLSHPAFLKSDEYLKGKIWEIDRNIRRDTALQQLGLADTGVSDDFAYLKEQDEEYAPRREAKRQYRIRSAGKRKPSLSGIGATDELANLDIINERLDRLDRIRAFGRATRGSGFSRYAEAERRSNDRIDYERGLEAEELHRRRMSDKSFEFEMLDKDEQFIQSSMRDKGWSREQAESVYFKNLTENTKWLRFIARDNPKIAKNLIPIAKAVGKASGIPFIGGLFANPMTAIAALGVGAIARTVSGADEANATIKKWKAYEGLYGNPTDKQKRMARLAGINDVASIAKTYGRLNVQRGDAESYLMNMGMAFRIMDERSAQLLAESEGLSPEEVLLAKLYAGESASRGDIVDANIEQLKEIQERGFKTDSGVMATVGSLLLSIPYAKSAVARGMLDVYERFDEQLEKIRSKEWGKNRAWNVASNYRYMADAIHNTWDEVHETAEIDDRYRAGMYDNSVTNNDASRSVSLQVNVASPQITTTGDPIDFAKGIANIGSRALSEYQSVIENTDTKRTK